MISWAFSANSGNANSHEEKLPHCNTAKVLAGLGIMFMMNSQLSRLVAEYQESVQVAVKLLYRSGIPMPVSSAVMVNNAAANDSGITCSYV